MDIHQARTEPTPEVIKAKMDIQQGKMEATVHPIQSELEETIKFWVEDVLLRVVQKTRASAGNLMTSLMEHRVPTGSTDIPWYASEEPPEKPSTHKEGLSWRAVPHVPSEGAYNEGPNFIPAHTYTYCKENYKFWGKKAERHMSDTQQWHTSGKHWCSLFWIMKYLDVCRLLLYKCMHLYHLNME